MQQSYNQHSTSECDEPQDLEISYLTIRCQFSFILATWWKDRCVAIVVYFDRTINLELRGISSMRLQQ